jgi:hypothetical protein
LNHRPPLGRLNLARPTDTACFRTFPAAVFRTEKPKSVHVAPISEAPNRSSFA